MLDLRVIVLIFFYSNACQAQHSFQIPKVVLKNVTELPQIEEYPYQVSIQNGIPEHCCVGTIVAPSKVLTVVQCVDNPLVAYTIRAGSSDLSDPNAIVVPVYRITIDSRYTVQSPYTYNIAILDLAKNLPVNDKIRPIPIARQPALPGVLATVTGWGSKEQNTQPSNQLRTFQATILNYCSWPSLSKYNFCASTVDISPCYGDLGAPLVIQGHLYGILTDFHKSCIPNMLPGLYTSVSNYDIFWGYANMLSEGKKSKN